MRHVRFLVKDSQILSNNEDGRGDEVGYCIFGTFQCKDAWRPVGGGTDSKRVDEEKGIGRWID